MNKEEAVRLIMDKVYSSDVTVMLSEKEVKEANDYYKRNFKRYSTFDDFLDSAPKIKNVVVKLKSGKIEMAKQFEAQEGMQPGILSECNFVQTLAQLLKLNKCVDLISTPINLLPKDCIPFINSGANTFSCARYLYYNKNNPDMFIFQYGNPASGDAEILITGNKIRLEFKERKAKGGEYDLTYGEDGKLIPSQTILTNFAEMVVLINKFNSETTVFEQVGSNYNKFDEDTTLRIAKKYFANHSVDILVSTETENKLIAITPNNFDVVLPGGKKIISTQSSEIRTAGRNSTKVFTPIYFDWVLQELGVLQDETGMCMVEYTEDNPDLCFAKARGKDTISRFKIHHIFFVPVENITQDGNLIMFNKKDVKQLKPSISMHLTIVAQKSEIVKAIKDGSFRL